MVVPAGGALPLDLRGQALPGPRRERLGLVPRHVLDGLVPGDRLAEPEPDPLPAVVAVLPVERRLDALAAAPLPALRTPRLARAVAALGHELGELRVRHRRSVDEERRQLHVVRLELAVVRPRLVDGAQGERAVAHVDLLGAARRTIREGRVARGIDEALAELNRLQHRLLLLELRLHHEPEYEPVSQERARRLEIDVLEHVEHALAHVRCVVACLGGAQRGKLGVAVRERPIDVAVAIRDRRVALDVAQQPQLLEVGDLRELPDERCARRYLRDELALADRLEQGFRLCPRVLESRGKLDSHLHISNSAEAVGARLHRSGEMSLGRYNASR